MSRYRVGQAIALLGLIGLLINALDYLFGVSLLGTGAAPAAMIPISMAWILIGAALMKRNAPPVP